jgi:DNA polymerase-4
MDCPVTRRIAHLDMDAFYASVELLRYPMLRGLPLVIGGRRIAMPAPEKGLAGFQRLKDYSGRGVVTTATYEARAFGVHSGMGLMKAALLAPQAILLPADFEHYRHYSGLFKAAVTGIAPTIEDRGIDEIFIDLTAIQGDSQNLARQLRQQVRDATGLSCSIGVAPNKMLAKLASDMDKPDGQTLLNLVDMPDLVWPLPVNRINGIGPRTHARLASMGVKSIGDLAVIDLSRLIAEFGRRQGHWLAEVAQGHDERPLVTLRETKSISRETTFERDLHPATDRAELSEILLTLCMRLQEDLARKGYQSRAVGIKVKFADFQTITRNETIAFPTADPLVIRSAARVCLRRIRFDQKFRLLGIRLGALVRSDAVDRNLCPSTHQGSLIFDEPVA